MVAAIPSGTYAQKHGGPISSTNQDMIISGHEANQGHMMLPPCTPLFTLKMHGRDAYQRHS
jgi:hypothetical protein